MSKSKLSTLWIIAHQTQRAHPLPQAELSMLGLRGQFVRDSQLVSNEHRRTVKRLLLDRLSLRDICRVTELSLNRFLKFISKPMSNSCIHISFRTLSTNIMHAQNQRREKG